MILTNNFFLNLKFLINQKMSYLKIKKREKLLKLNFKIQEFSVFL